MKKKILICLLAIIALFTLSGCKKKAECTGDDCNKVKVKETLSAKVGERNILFNTEARLGKLTFSHPSTANAGNNGVYAVFDEKNEDKLLYKVAIYVFENKTEEEVMGSSLLNRKGTVKIDDREWTVYEGEGEDSFIKTIVYTEGNDTYTISYFSDYDLVDFYKTFNKTLKFKTIL